MPSKTTKPSTNAASRTSTDTSDGNASVTWVCINVRTRVSSVTPASALAATSTARRTEPITRNRHTGVSRGVPQRGCVMRLHDLHIEVSPIHRVRALNAKRGGGRASVSIPILRGRVTGLPDGLEALVFTGDLQGVAPVGPDSRLVLAGCVVAEELAALGASGELPAPSRTGVVLTGDLFSSPDAMKRGGFGDVREVWAAFSKHARWVAGVAGNHDDVSGVRSAGLLDGSLATFDTLRLGGVGLICGDPHRAGRRAEADQLAAIELVAEQSPDVLVLHEGPAGSPSQRGNSAMALTSAPLIACGHVHWDEPVFTHEHGAVLNVDGRVVVLTR